jgi:Leucine-rich repeat (LRR) protein
MISLKKRAAALLLICLAALSLLPSAALAAGDVKLDEEHFPDTGFREYLSQSIFNTVGDGILSESEIGAIKKINVSKKGIARLDGLEYLTALEYLSCSQNLLTALDVSKNTGLRVLDVNGNQLTKLDVSKNPGLKNLTAEDNQLTALDLSKNPELGLLACDGNKLTALDVTPARSWSI